MYRAFPECGTRTSGATRNQNDRTILVPEPPGHACTGDGMERRGPLPGEDQQNGLT